MRTRKWLATIGLLALFVATQAWAETSLGPVDHNFISKSGFPRFVEHVNVLNDSENPELPFTRDDFLDVTPSQRSSEVAFFGVEVGEKSCPGTNSAASIELFYPVRVQSFVKWSFSSRPICVHSQFFRRSLSGVFEYNGGLDHWARVIGDNSFEVKNRNVRPDLRMTNFAVIADGLPGLVQRLPEHEQAADTDNQPERPHQNRTEAPQGHILLGLQILVGGILLLVGVNLLRYAGSQRLAGLENDVAAAGYFMGGLILLGLGLLAIFSIFATAIYVF